MSPGVMGASVVPQQVRLVAFDLDGVIWRGGEVLPGVGAALDDVLRRGLRLRYVSNNSTAHRRTVSERLAALGLPAGSGRVLTSAYVAGEWLRARLPAGAPVMVVGEAGLLEELKEAGLDAYHAGAPPAPTGTVPPAAVVVGMDRTIDFATITAAQQAIRAGALFVATNRDPTFPTPTGEVPGAGAIVAAVAAAAQAEPSVMGKPGLGMAHVLADTSGVRAEETVFVGDRISTDVAMGAAAGMITVLVLTGVTTREEVEALGMRVWQAGDPTQHRGALLTPPHRGKAPLVPDYVLPDLRGLPALLDGLGCATPADD